MAEYIPKYFCKETKCVHYNLIRTLESALKVTICQTALKRDIGIAKVHCQQACERTAQQFYQWLNQKGLTQIVSKID